ncbi:MAG TPA: CHAT domain-containing protein [Candidatus Contendobacter sp.]|nr:CHAT domain-containing protein [Candidatus Contendobacter sp.]
MTTDPPEPPDGLECAETLQWYVNAGFTARERGQWDQAADYFDQGLARAERFLDQDGETAAGVREQALKLYVNAGFNANQRGQPDQEAAYYDRGLARAERFLDQDGETAAGVREQALKLYVNAGFNANQRGQPDQEAAYYDRGLARAERFLDQDGETAAGVREQALKLYVNAGFNANQRGQPDQEAAYYDRGLARAERFLDQDGETAAGVREQALKLYVNAGFNANQRGQPDQEAAYYDRGLARAERFLDQDGETAAGVREQALKLYVNAGFNANQRGQPDQEAAYYDRGLARAERFLDQDGETAAGVRERSLRLYFNAGAAAENRGLIRDARRYYLQYLALYWTWGFTRQTLDLPRFNQTSLRNLPEDAVLPLWTDVLHVWLRCHGPQIAHLTDRELDTLLRTAEAALLLAHAERNDRFRALFARLLDFQKEVQTACDAHDGALRKTQNSLQDVLQRLGLDPGWPPTPEGYASLQQTLDQQPWWQRLRRWRKGQRARREMQRSIHQCATPPRLTEAQWQQIQDGQRALADWLVERWRTALGLSKRLHENASVALAVLLAAQPQAPTKTAERWWTEPPWADPDPATLITALDHTGWREWLPADDGDTTRRALYAWTMRQPHGRRLQIEESLLNRPNPDLQSALLDHHRGCEEPLRTWLAAAWQQAQQDAQPLGRLLETWAQHQQADQPLDLSAVKNNAISPAADAFATALAAVALGDVEAVISAAVQDWLNRILPLDRDDLAATLQRAKQRFAQVLSADPGLPAAPALQQRLHNWSLAALQRELAASDPDLDALWIHLERGRIALTGLTVTAPDEQWNQTTAKNLLQAIQTHLDPDSRPGTPWPPLTCWLEQTARVLPGAPRVDDCQERLQPAEALAQLFFDPNTDRLQALWLTRDQPLTRRFFPESAQGDRWRGPEGILSAWDAWVENGELSHRFPARFAQLTRADQPAHAVIAALSQWASAAGCDRVALVLPAELAQLPWEAFAPASLILTRVVNLTGWRNTRNPPPVTDPQAFVAYDPDPGYYGAEQAKTASDYWGIAKPVASTTAFDLMAGLHTRTHSHLILHGHYQPLDPRASHLKVNQVERIFAWCLAALNPHGHFGLSACQAGLHGRAAAGWLGSVGLGPALVAAGARRVIAPLWRCDAVATWLFHQLLYQAAADQPTESWSRLLAQARTRLRDLSLDEVKKWLGKRYREADFEDAAFANPYYWAGFILIGEDDPWPKPASASDAPSHELETAR